MPKYELKTKKNESNVEDFLNTISEEQKRNDSFTILNLMKKASKAEPKMWGSSIIGFGDIHYKHASGQEGDWFKIGFSPRKQNLTLYVGCSSPEVQKLMPNLGKYKIGKGCMYISKISDVDLRLLKEIINVSVKRKTL